MEPQSVRISSDSYFDENKFIRSAQKDLLQNHQNDGKLYIPYHLAQSKIKQLLLNFVHLKADYSRKFSEIEEKYLNDQNKKKKMILEMMKKKEQGLKRQMMKSNSETNLQEEYEKEAKKNQKTIDKYIEKYEDMEEKRDKLKTINKKLKKENEEIQHKKEKEEEKNKKLKKIIDSYKKNPKKEPNLRLSMEIEESNLEVKELKEQNKQLLKEIDQLKLEKENNDNNTVYSTKKIKSETLAGTGTPPPNREDRSFPTNNEPKDQKSTKINPKTKREIKILQNDNKRLLLDLQRLKKKIKKLRDEQKEQEKKSKKEEFIEQKKSILIQSTNEKEEELSKIIKEKEKIIEENEKKIKENEKKYNETTEKRKLELRILKDRLKSVQEKSTEEKNNFLNQIFSKNNEIGALKNKLEDSKKLKSATNAMTEKTSLLESEKAKIKQEFEEYKKKIEKETEEFQNSKKKLKEKIEKLEKNEKQQLNNIQELEKEKEQKSTTINELEQKINENSKLHANIELEFKNLRLEKDEELKKRKELEEKIEKSKEDQKKEEKERNELSKQYENLKNEYNKVIARKKEVVQKLSNTKMKLGFVIVKHDKIKEQFQKSELQRRRLHNMIEDQKGKMRVYIRCRPLNTREKEANMERIVRFTSASDIEIITNHDKIGTNEEKRKKFGFNRTFGPNQSQKNVYKDVSDLVQSALDGFNTSIFAYGQTGSGKTYTIGGEKDNPGIVPRAVEDVFNIQLKRKKLYKYEIESYMLELYLGDLHDLYVPKSKKNNQEKKKSKQLKIKKNSKGHVVVTNTVKKKCANAKELMKHYHEGLKNRHTRKTKMNDESSRSHLIFAINIKCHNLTNKSISYGKLSLIDLAGSERSKKTGLQDKVGLKEARAINTSLSALGNVINALATKAKFVPYRVSPLTMLLSDSLGGNAKTLMIICVSPASGNMNETLNSLQYGNRARKIVNKIEKSIDNSSQSKLRFENKLLRRILKSKVEETEYEKLLEEIQNNRNN